MLAVTALTVAAVCAVLVAAVVAYACFALAVAQWLKGAAELGAPDKEVDE